MAQVQQAAQQRNADAQDREKRRLHHTAVFLDLLRTHRLKDITPALQAAALERRLAGVSEDQAAVQAKKDQADQVRAQRENALVQRENAHKVAKQEREANAKKRLQEHQAIQGEYLAEEQAKNDRQHAELGAQLEKKHIDVTADEQNITDSLKGSLMEQGNIVEKIGRMTDRVFASLEAP